MLQKVQDFLMNNKKYPLGLLALFLIISLANAVGHTLDEDCYKDKTVDTYVVGEHLLCELLSSTSSVSTSSVSQ